MSKVHKSSRLEIGRANGERVAIVLSFEPSPGEVDQRVVAELSREDVAGLISALAGELVVPVGSSLFGPAGASPGACGTCGGSGMVRGAAGIVTICRGCSGTGSVGA